MIKNNTNNNNNNNNMNNIQSNNTCKNSFNSKKIYLDLLTIKIQLNRSTQTDYISQKKYNLIFINIFNIILLRKKAKKF